jgi:gamma-glutamyltranspeptidase/glutathione hydrolase
MNRLHSSQLAPANPDSRPACSLEWGGRAAACRPRFLSPRFLAAALAAILAVGLTACSSNLDALEPSLAPTPVGGCELDGMAAVATATVATDANAPEMATGYAPKKLVHAKTYMAITNHPLSTKIACEVLKRGGTAADAAVAAQMALNLVEPQSSGIGGGAFILYYDAKTRRVIAYDGRETAPAAAEENDLRWRSATDHTAPAPDPMRSGRAIGTPGVLRALELLHAEQGRLPWHDLFAPAIRLARNGFAVSPRMAASIAAPAALARIRRDPEMAAYFLDADGQPRRAGTLITNPALAHTFTVLAERGADAFYQDGPIARAIVAKIGARFDGGTTPGRTSLRDLAAYRARKRPAVCADYRSYVVCGMPPPSSGGIAVAQTLGILANFDLAHHAPAQIDGNGGRPSVLGVHLVVEAEHLAYADRDKYVADTDFVPLPGGGWRAMLDHDYLRRRAALINPREAMALPAPAGQLGRLPLAAPQTAEHGTSQISLLDRYGNAVSMTTTIEAAFGSYHMTRGFLLNNQLTDFSAAPTVNGELVANRLQAGKRPRSSMAPTLVFRRKVDGSRGDFVLATGSPGGASIIQYVVKTLVEHPNLDLSVPAHGQAGDNDPLVRGLRALGHRLNLAAQASGLSAIVKSAAGDGGGLTGGVDPRREGVVLGDICQAGAEWQQPTASRDHVWRCDSH